MVAVCVRYERSRPCSKTIGSASIWRSVPASAVSPIWSLKQVLAPGGVLYLITVEQSEHLDRTEGVPRGAYRRIPVRAIVDGSERIEAFAYQSDRISLGRKPSPRYLGLLIEGAVQHGLPPVYLRYLRSFELAADERLSQPQRS
jgi:hypothetical protein